VEHVGQAQCFTLYKLRMPTEHLPSICTVPIYINAVCVKKQIDFMTAYMLHNPQQQIYATPAKNKQKNKKALD
jgi:hypothetical protein